MLRARLQVAGCGQAAGRRVGDASSHRTRSWTERRVKISDCTICWTPNSERYPVGFRAKVRIFSAGTPDPEMAPFACRAGRFDARAQDPRAEVRGAYVLAIALMMTERDGLDVEAVHRFLVDHIEEYRSACAPELLEEEVPK
jgi:hypothetical protein